jgi:hypothetical protein
MLGRIRLNERAHLRKIRSRCRRSVMASRIGGPIYLGKPTAEVWRTDCKGERNRIICLNLWDVSVKEDEKDQKKNERHA